MNSTISRRTFLAGASTAAASALVASSAIAEEAKSAAGSATYLAGYTDELFDYYVNLAKGGVEMIWVEGEAFALGEDGTFGADALDFGKRLVEACAE